MTTTLPSCTAISWRYAVHPAEDEIEPVGALLRCDDGLCPRHGSVTAPRQIIKELLHQCQLHPFCEFEGQCLEVKMAAARMDLAMQGCFRQANVDSGVHGTENYGQGIDGADQPFCGNDHGLVSEVGLIHQDHVGVHDLVLEEASVHP